MKNNGFEKPTIDAFIEKSVKGAAMVML